MSDLPAIDIQNLTRRFGDFTAVDAISLQVPHGSLFGFLGLNGAGKSTTVRILTGLLPATSGDASIEGFSIRNQALEVKRRIGVLPDDLALFDRLTLWEHLALVGPIYGLSREETETRGAGLLKLLDLWDERGTFAGQASHGMRKKTALALALIHNPRVLFLDEPFEGIDPVSGKTIRDLLVSSVRRGVTVFITSHILEIIERLADHVAVIHSGRIVARHAMAEIRSSGRTLEDVFVEAVGGRHEDTADLSWLT
jgi:ABC-2 type transport system ATP-binding protein